MYRLIAPLDLKSRLDGESAPRLVDLRGEEAYAEGHLPGALSVPAGVKVERWIPQRIPTVEDVVLYDEGGEAHTAAHEASHLSHLWYHGIFVLAGGLAAWKDAGLPLESGPPVDPLGQGRHIETRMPPPETIPAEFAPKESA